MQAVLRALLQHVADHARSLGPDYDVASGALLAAIQRALLTSNTARMSTDRWRGS